MKQKNWIKTWIVLVIVSVICFSDLSFAAETEKGLWTLSEFLNFLISIVSWIWIIFAKIAWEFLTNKWVYGEVLKIDILLWQYRNIVKNMANFCLWFYLVYVIFKWLIWQSKWSGKILENLKNTLLWILIAWIWVQASRFLTSVVIDVSTITLTAVWSLPAQIVSKNESLKQAIEVSRQSFATGGKIYELFPKDWSANSLTRTLTVSVNKNLTQEQFLDEILPSTGSVSWPLYYMWWSILRTNEINSINDKNLKKSLINLVVQGGTTIVYSIEIAVLCVLALMRILYLWMFIVLSPLAILLTCIKKAWDKDLSGIWFVSDLMKQINLKTFLFKAFQPAVVVLWISVCVVFVSLINQVVNKDYTKTMDGFDIGWAKITTNQDNNGWLANDDITYTTRIDWKLLKLSVAKIWKWFLDFMLAIITVVLVYLVIKMTIKMWWWDDFVSKGINKIQDSVEWAITSIPIVPVPWYDKQWVATTRGISWQWLKSLPVSKFDHMTKKKTSATSDQIDLIMAKWWFTSENTLTESQRNGIKNVWSNLLWLRRLEAKRDYIRDDDNWIMTEKWKWMVLNPMASDKFWIQEFTSWLNETKPSDVSDPDWNWMLKEWQGQPENKRNLRKLFDTSSWKYASAYAKLFWYTSWNYTSFDSIMNLDISKK